MRPTPISPEMKVAALATALMVGVGLVRLAQWLQAKPTSADPWDAETDLKLEEAEARPLCVRCLCPYEETDWFCPQCGRATSPTTNWMPYLDELSMGDVLRHGTGGRIPVKPLTVIGYVVLALTQYFIFAPIYWWQLWQNVRRWRHDRLTADPDLPPTANQTEQ